MVYRNASDIFPMDYPFIPDEEEVMRQCRSWLYQILETQTLRTITERIKAIVDPFRREFTVTLMWNYVQQEAADPDSDVRLSAMQLEELEHELRIITRGARTEQLSIKMDTTEQMVTNPPIPHHADSYHASMEEDIAFLKKEVERLGMLVQQGIKKSLHWPFYTPVADEDAKHTFEDYLIKLCHSKKKSLTKDIKNYLELKVKQGIITRPEQINVEFELLQKFGYPYIEKTYYNS